MLNVLKLARSLENSLSFQALRFSSCDVLLKKISINDLYCKDLSKIEITKEAELARVMKVISSSNIELEENVAEAAHFKHYRWCLDTIKVKPTAKFKGLHLGKLSARFYGNDSSEIHQAEQAWEDLMIKAKIKNPNVFLVNLNDLGLSLPWTLIGSYLVKDFDASIPRYPIKVFDSAIRIPGLFKSGPLTKEDKKAFKQYLEKNPDPDLLEASKKLNRPRMIVRQLINHYKNQGKTNVKFTVEEYKLIMVLYFDGKIPISSSDLEPKFHCDEDTAQELGRSQGQIKLQWDRIMKPTLQAYLTGKLDESFDFKQNLFNFVIETKPSVYSELDTKLLLEKYPYVNKWLIYHSLYDVFNLMRQSKRPGPLHQRCKEYLDVHNGQVQYSKFYKKSRLDIIEAFERLKSK